MRNIFICVIVILSLFSCKSVDDPETQRQIGVIVASVYKYKEKDMSPKYKHAATVSYKVLSALVDSASAENDLEAIRMAIDEYGKKHGLTPEELALAKLTFTQVYHRAALGKLTKTIRLERLRHIKSGIDSVIQ